MGATAMTHPADDYLTAMLGALTDSVFWVALTFGAMLLYIFFHGYWTRWAHRKVDALAKRVDDAEREITSINGDINEIRSKNPLSWMRRVKD